MALGRVFSSLVLSVIALAADPPQCNGACAEGDEVQFLHVKEHGKLDSKDKNSANGVVFKVSPVKSEKNSLLSKGVKTTVSLGGGANGGAAREVGYLRALNQMGLLDGIDQMAEGAGLVTAPLLYAKGLTLDQLLGPPTEPANLTLANIAVPSGKILDVMTYRVVWSIFHTAAAALNVAPVSNAEFFETVIALNYLCPFGLNGKLPAAVFAVAGAPGLPPLPAGCSENLQNQNQVWALDEAHLQRMAGQNPTLDFQGNLTIQRTSVRSHVIGGGLGPPVGHFPLQPNTPFFWFSPDQCGVPFFPYDPIFKSFDYEPLNSSEAARKDVVLGGGVVDSIACLSTLAPTQSQEQQGKTEEANSNFAESNSENAAIFTLQDAVSIASNDYDTAAVYNITGLLDTLDALLGAANQTRDPLDPYPINQQRVYWPPAGPERGDVQEKAHVVFNGNQVSGFGIVHALQSGAECYMSLTGTGLQYGGDARVQSLDIPLISDFLDCQSLKITNFSAWAEWVKRPPVDVRLFGIDRNDSFSFTIPDEASLPGISATRLQLFGPDSLFPLLCKVQESFDNGGPVRASATLTTLQNIRWGIEAGQKIRVLFVFQEQSPDWEALLPEETRTMIQNGSFTGGLTGRDGWPFLQPTYPQAAPGPVPPDKQGVDPSAISPQQANLKAAQAEWEMLQMREDVEACMNGGKQSYYARSSHPRPWGFNRHWR